MSIKTLGHRHGSRKIVALVALVALVGLVSGALIAASGGSASGAEVTRGDFHAFAAGAGLDISGHAQMVRDADGTTIVTIHVAGLVSGRPYASHVHKLACGVSNADGHFQQVPGAGSTPPNEIWLGDGPFSANSGGIANENATAAYTANTDAVSVVVHDLTLPATNNRVACADLS
jgi:hypothetical protein